MKNIAELDYSTGATLAVIVSFYVIMFTFVEVPLVGFIVAKDWTKKNVTLFNAWLGQNLLRLASGALGVVGVVEIARGLFALHSRAGGFPPALNCGQATSRPSARSSCRVVTNCASPLEPELQA